MFCHLGVLICIQGKVKDPKVMYVCAKRIQESLYFIGGKFSQKIQNSIEKNTDKAKIQVKSKDSRTKET